VGINIFIKRGEIMGENPPGGLFPGDEIYVTTDAQVNSRPIYINTNLKP
jgi:hypothetical protein